MQGLHLCADWCDCPAQAVMVEPLALRTLCAQAVQAVGLTAVAECFHAFEPAGSGVTGVVLLAESHLAIHTWPERGAVTVDVYVCNFSADNRAKAYALLATLQSAFEPGKTLVQALERGALGADSSCL